MLWLTPVRAQIHFTSFSKWNCPSVLVSCKFKVMEYIQEVPLSPELVIRTPIITPIRTEP